jgi:hypothetical protein
VRAAVGVKQNAGRAAKARGAVTSSIHSTAYGLEQSALPPEAHRLLP